MIRDPSYETIKQTTNQINKNCVVLKYKGWRGFCFAGLLNDCHLEGWLRSFLTSWIFSFTREDGLTWFCTPVGENPESYLTVIMAQLQTNLRLPLVWFVLGITPGSAQGLSCLCSQESLLALSGILHCARVDDLQGKHLTPSLSIPYKLSSQHLPKTNTNKEHWVL